MSVEELARVQNTQAEIDRLKLEQVVQELERSQEIEKSWLRSLLLQALEELDLAGREVIELCQASATVVEKLEQ